MPSDADEIDRAGIRAAANQHDFAAQADYGLKLLEAERFHDAIQPFEAARAIRPNDITLLCNLSTAYSMSGKGADAEAIAAEAIRLSGGRYGIFEMANALRMDRRFVEAVPLFEEAARREPDDVGIKYNLAWSLHGAGRFEEALYYYRQVLTEWPDVARAFELSGQTLVALERYDDAVPVLRRAIALAPGMRNAHYNLGYALLKLGEYDEGVKAYRAMLDVYPDSIVEVGQNLASALDELDRPAEAEAVRAARAEALARRAED